MPKEKRDKKVPKGSKNTIRSTIWDQPNQISPDKLKRIAEDVGFAFSKPIGDELSAIYGRYKGRRTRSEKADVIVPNLNEQIAFLHRAITTAEDAAKAILVNGYVGIIRKEEFLEKLSDLSAITQRMRSRIKPEEVRTGDKPDLLTDSLVGELAGIWKSHGLPFDRSTKGGSFIAFVRVFCGVLELDVSWTAIDTAVRKLLPD
ncbi:MAG: hypothetical protein ACK4FK_14685 [Ferrovibrio sp.]|uniref:hypothetical protein n=1 Tax=Ferrovibrio sp. TaxID=1917215 RepID=UPI00391C2E9F